MEIIGKAHAQIAELNLGRLYGKGAGTAFDSDTLINKVVTWVLVLAGLVAFLYLIYSGFMYLTAGGNPDAAKKGQQGIINAIIGLVIIFLSWAIIRTVIVLLG